MRGRLRVMRHGLNGKTAFWSKALRCVVILKATTLPLPLLLSTGSVTSSYFSLLRGAGSWPKHFMHFLLTGAC